jgi:hypothetical protein
MEFGMWSVLEYAFVLQCALDWFVRVASDDER